MSEDRTDEQFVREGEAAAIVNVKPPTMAFWRSKNRGPAWFKLEGSIRYRRCDLDEFIAKSRQPAGSPV